MLIVTVMGDNGSKFIDMCFGSIMGADRIIFCWGEEDQQTLNKFNEWKKIYPDKFELISLKFDQNNLGQNGITRNYYLNFLKKNYPNDWNLSLDLDEVVEDLSKIKEFIQTAGDALYSVKMEHFIGDLGHVDNTVQTHYVLNRLFKISEADKYPEVEHPILEGRNKGITDCTTIWHLAYCGFMWDIKKRYENHIKKSNIHTPQFLEDWRDAHYFGTYPKRQLKPTEIPDIILKYFGVEKDKYYFQNRNMEFKHILQVKQWFDYFKPYSVLDLGSGKGPYLFFWKWFTEANGIEISEWAINNAFCPGIMKGDISKEWPGTSKEDLITAIDVLEHLTDEELDSTLKQMSERGNKFIFSIPFIGDPNLTNDKTHLQFHEKQWWIDKIKSYNILIKETPQDWLFKDQILIGIKENI